MLTDLCMLDELAMRLKVQGGMRWSPGTATRLGRTGSVIRSLPLHATSSSSFRVSSSVVIDDVGRISVPIKGKESCRLSCFCGLKSGATLEASRIIVQAR